MILERSAKDITIKSTDPFATVVDNTDLAYPVTLFSETFEMIVGKVETIFDDTVEAIEQTEEVVGVRFEHSKPQSFSLVIGADALHWKVRSIAFGAEQSFEHYLGFNVAAFQRWQLLQARRGCLIEGLSIGAGASIGSNWVSWSR